MIRILSTVALACVVGALGLSAQSKHVDLKDAKGNSVGMAMISPAQGGGVSVDLEVKGLPAGEHALHFHAVPKCEAPFTSAGSHFNPAMKKHGMQNPEGPHAGDLPNLLVEADGSADTVFAVPAALLARGPGGVFQPEGAAVVVHAGRDDQRTDPSGNSGARLACGVIGPG